LLLEDGIDVTCSKNGTNLKKKVPLGKPGFRLRGEHGLLRHETRLVSFRTGVSGRQAFVDTVMRFHVSQKAGYFSSD
jgi:hypothetical protein